MRIPAKVAVIAAAVALAVISGTFSSGASAATLGTTARNPVTLTVRPAPFFRVGLQGSTFEPCGEYSRATVALRYHASAPSGISGYDITGLLADGTPFAEIHTTNHTPITWVADNYDDTCGGGADEKYAWQITAHDNAGHSTTKFEIFGFTVVHWDNTSTPGQFYPPDTWAFSRRWSASACPRADGGTQNRSTASGAWGSYVAHATAGEHLGLMMATGPTRGRARVYVDGTLSATIDTYAVHNRNRIYVWDSGPLTKGRHVVKIVNLATPGRSRLDINAMGVLTGTVLPA